MGYMHITPLYKEPDIFLLREVYALEKIHGSSAHVRYRKGEPLHFFAGGIKGEAFVAIFDQEDLARQFVELGHDSVVVYGEVYGGKHQAMAHVYGDKLRFVAFDVLVGDVWLAVENAQGIAAHLGLEFVPFEKIPCVKEALEARRDDPSLQGLRNAAADGRTLDPTKAPREGIVVRPLIELKKSNGSRLMAKFVSERFRETRGGREIGLDPAQLAVIRDARAAAEEWVTPNRLEHVLQKVHAPDVSHTGTVVKAMLEDVRREAAGEVVWSKDVEKAIGQKTAQLFRRRITAA